MALKISKKAVAQKPWWLKQRKSELDIYPEEYFLHELMQERKRAQRSKRPLVVMLVDAKDVHESVSAEEMAELVCEGVKASVRETDICGYLQKDLQVAVILTSIEVDRMDFAERVIRAKVRENVAALAGDMAGDQLKIVFHVISPSTPDQFSDNYWTTEELEQAAVEPEPAPIAENDKVDEQELNLRKLARFLQECSKSDAKADRLQK